MKQSALMSKMKDDVDDELCNIVQLNYTFLKKVLLPQIGN